MGDSGLTMPCAVCARLCCVVLCECNTCLLLLLRILTSDPAFFLSFSLSLFPLPSSSPSSPSLSFLSFFFFFSFLLRYRAVADQMDQAGSGLAGSAEGGPEPYVLSGVGVAL